MSSTQEIAQSGSDRADLRRTVLSIITNNHHKVALAKILRMAQGENGELVGRVVAELMAS